MKLILPEFKVPRGVPYTAATSLVVEGAGPLVKVSRRSNAHPRWFTREGFDICADAQTAWALTHDSVKPSGNRGNEQWPWLPWLLQLAAENLTLPPLRMWRYRHWNTSSTENYSSTAAWDGGDNLIAFSPSNGRELIPLRMLTWISVCYGEQDGILAAYNHEHA
jgi:hypothetical protein